MKIRSGRRILIYSAGQGLRVMDAPLREIIHTWQYLLPFSTGDTLNEKFSL